MIGTKESVKAQRLGWGRTLLAVMLSAAPVGAVDLAAIDLGVDAKVRVLPGFRPICVSTGDPTNPAKPIRQCVDVPLATDLEIELDVDAGVAPAVTIGPAGLPTHCPNINLRVDVTVVDADATLTVRLASQVLASKSVSQSVTDFVAVCQ